MKTITCASCGTPFCLDAALERSLRESGRSFYCPNGHSLSFRPSETTRLRELVNKLEKHIAWQRDDIKTLRARVDELEGTAHAYRMLYGKARKQAQQ